MSTSSEGSIFFDRVTAAIDELRDELIDISLDIHAHPELNYEEHYASAVLTEALE